MKNLLSRAALPLIALTVLAAPTFAQSLTAPQKNAVRSAKQYLDMQGFSRAGLINQLSSDARAVGAC